MNNNQYWKQYHQDALKQWILCASAVTSAGFVKLSNLVIDKKITHVI